MVENSPEMNAEFAHNVKLKVIPTWPRRRTGQVIPPQQMLCLNLEPSSALMTYMIAPTWEEACTVLERCPIYRTRWPVHVLRGLVDGGRLSAKDSELFCRKIAFLELAREIDLPAARKLLTLRHARASMNP